MRWEKDARQVVAQELHDEGRVLVALLGQGVELCDRIVERLLCERACLVGAREDLVVEDGEVECEAETASPGQLDATGPCALLLTG